MKTTKMNLRSILFLLVGIFAFSFTACDKEEDAAAKDPIASFQFKVDTENYLKVNFTNFSSDATKYAWDFGDEKGTSTEKDPSYIYETAGTYTVKLTASNDAGAQSIKSETITITDPNVALKLLTGETSKKWKLFREGVTMGIGETAETPNAWWALENDGKRPCVYKQSWTFNFDGTFTFDDAGVMWGEGGLFPDAINETCFEATAANMVNVDGIDVSAWLGGTHNFEYDPTVGKLTLSGKGAWIGLIKVTPNGDVTVPQESVEYDVVITEETGYDVMTVSVTGSGFYWQFNYVSYDDWANEPELVEEAAPFGEDLPDLTATAMKISFASRDAADLVELDTVASVSTVIFGVTDPAGGATKVGEFNRTTETYQELKIMTSPDLKDMQFTNFTSVSVDVYFPSTADYTTGLVKSVELGFADVSQTEEWWNDVVTETKADVATDQWVTLTFDLTNAKARTDLDMIFIRLGGNGHTAPGKFYIKNLEFK